MSVPNKAMRPALYDLLESGGGGGYELPIASSSTLGGVKVGENLSIDSAGSLSGDVSADDLATVEGIATATANHVNGIEEILGDDEEGMIHDVNVLKSRTSDLEDATDQNIESIQVLQADDVELDIRVTALENVPLYTLPTASSSTLGGVKVGANLSIAQDGTLSATGSSYTLPVADASTLGGVKVGANLSATQDGTLSAAVGQTDLDNIDATLAGIAARVSTLENTMPEFTMGSGSADNITIATDGRSNVIVSDVAPSGYTISGIRQIAISNASNGGTNREYCVIQSFSTTGGGVSLQVQVKNISTVNNAKIKVDVVALCLKS